MVGNLHKFHRRGGFGSSHIHISCMIFHLVRLSCNRHSLRIDHSPTVSVSRYMNLVGIVYNPRKLWCSLGISGMKHLQEVFWFYHRKLVGRMFSARHQLSRRYHSKHKFHLKSKSGWYYIGLGDIGCIVLVSVCHHRFLW